MQYGYAERMQRVKPNAIRTLLRYGKDPELISFGGGWPYPEIFPHEELCVVYDKLLKDQYADALQYTVSEGLPALREKIAERMRKVGVDCGLENIFMISGGQQGLDIAAKCFVNEGDVIVTEAPTFLGGLIAFNPMMPCYKGVAMDEDGMIMEDLEQVLKTTERVKMIYVIPDFQNPTGVSLSLERRKHMVELANRYKVIILEDNPYREVRFGLAPLPSIKSFDTEGRVIHLGCFSKILCPGMRLGWVVASKELAEKLCLLKMAGDTQCSTLNMYAVDQYLEMYDIDKQIAKICKIYSQKKDLMMEALRKNFGETSTFTNPKGGLFTWLSLPRDVDSAKFMEWALPKGKVAYVPGATFFPEKPEHNHCRINYSCLSDEKITEGIDRLGTLFQEYRQAIRV